MWKGNREYFIWIAAERVELLYISFNIMLFNFSMNTIRNASYSLKELSFMYSIKGILIGLND